MSMVSSLKLVFDDHWTVAVQISGKDIQGIASHRRFSLLQLQIHAQGFTKFSNILGQPRG